jgi:hypothetical protein
VAIDPAVLNLLARGVLATQSQAEPLPQPAAWGQVPFGPGQPIQPVPINALRPDSGRPEPRRSDYDVGWNLSMGGNRLVPFSILRRAADDVDLFRRCIEFRKAEVRGRGWDIVVSGEAVEKARREAPDKSESQISSALRDDAGDDIDRIKTWWEMPDRTNGLSFDAWVSQIMEEHLVLDAIAIYPRLTLGGDLFSLEVLDGSTIKPLLDERGNTPFPPSPAYQQILRGFPRGEFTADAIPAPDGDGFLIPDGYATDTLIYERSVVRTWTPYGFPVVEQALQSADLWLKRMEWMRAEYTDGVMPAGWMETDGEWTPAQLREWNTVFNDYLSGQTGTRQRVQTLPKGFKPSESRDVAEKYNAEYDEFILKLVVAHFGVLPSQLGFTPKGGLGGKGHQEGEEDTEDRVSTRPTTEWLARIFTKISRQYLGMDRSLEFKFLGLDAEDEKVADDQAEKQFRSARKTLNEDRDRLGLPRYTFPEADMPMVVGQTGVVFLEGELDRSQQYGVAPAPTPAGGVPVPGAPAAPGQAPPKQIGAAPAKPAAAPAKPAPNVAKTQELAALRRWSRTTRSRAFVANHLAPEDLPPDLQKADIVFKGDDASREDGRASAHSGDRPAREAGRSRFDWASV